jgi:hypothetical protein
MMFWRRATSLCDANSYDEAYMAPGEMVGRVKIRGRGGTILQPCVDFL